jgi:hypothetical protein
LCVVRTSGQSLIGYDAFGRRRRLWKVVAKGGDDASAGQMREHGLWLVSLDARFRIEAIQFRPPE